VDLPVLLLHLPELLPFQVLPARLERRIHEMRDAMASNIPCCHFASGLCRQYSRYFLFKTKEF
jgi:hypothetical protein